MSASSFRFCKTPDFKIPYYRFLLFYDRRHRRRFRLFLYDRKGTFLSYKKRRSAVDAHSREWEILPDDNRARRECALSRAHFFIRSFVWTQAENPQRYTCQILFYRFLILFPSGSPSPRRERHRGGRCEGRYPPGSASYRR